MADTEDRLQKLKFLLVRKKQHGNRLCWIRWNPNSDFSYDIEDAREDIEWMIYEIQKLKEENKQLHDFVNALRLDMEDELKKSPTGKKFSPPNAESGNS